MMDLEQLVALLFERLDWAEDVDDLVAELQSGSYGDPIPYLAILLNDPDEPTQESAMSAMMRIDSERAIDYALPRLSDPSWQFYICWWLLRVGTERTVMPLVDVLQSSDDVDTRLVAVCALRETGDTRAIPALEYARDHDLGIDYDGHPISHAAAKAIEAILTRNRI